MIVFNKGETFEYVYSLINKSKKLKTRFHRLGNDPETSFKEYWEVGKILPGDALKGRRSTFSNYHMVGYDGPTEYYCSCPSDKICEHVIAIMNRKW